MSDETEDALLIEAGKMSARLIHDFKNQIGGMKLYAAYLKKRFGAEPAMSEGVEIAEKIIQGLNEMAEQAALVSRLTRPIELRREAAELGACVEMAVSGVKSAAAAKAITLALESRAAKCAVSMDLQQMLAALGAILARAIEASPEGGAVTILLEIENNHARIEIADQGETPDEKKLQACFDPVTNERISRTSLGLALARRIVALHDGSVSARAGSPAGTVVEVRLKKLYSVTERIPFETRRKNSGGG